MTTPMIHQEEALKNIQIARANGYKRMTIVMPCGTGKTFTQLMTAVEMKAQTVLVLVPSLALIRQSIREWVKEGLLKRPNILCVCSDTKVTRKLEDEVVISKDEVGHPVTSDSREIAEFLKRKTGGPKLVFSTYHSSPLVSVGMPYNFSFDLGIFDEAHVTSGEEGGFFSFALEDSNLRIKERTFWTATPRHYDIEGIKEGNDLPTIYSMDDEDVYGPVVYKLPFRKAVEQGTIVDYEIVVSVVTNKMLKVKDLKSGVVMVDGKKVPATVIAQQVAIQNAIQEFDVRKIFTFHNRVVSAREFAGSGPESVIRRLPRDFKVLHVSGDMTMSQREEKLNALYYANRALMTNVRCLSQGVNVPTVDMVAILNKRKSLIEIVQISGRATRAVKGKEKGYVLVPIYVEQARGESLEKALQRSDFRNVWAVLSALRDQDEALTELMTRIRIRNEGGNDENDGGNDHPPRRILKVVGPRLLNLETIEQAITALCVNHLVPTIFYPSWEEASKAAKRCGIHTFKMYQKMYSRDPRLPSNPNLYYADVWAEKGYWSGFFGKGRPRIKNAYETLKEASQAVQRLGIKRKCDYQKRFGEDPRLPSNPDAYYEDEWEAHGKWPGFLCVAPRTRIFEGFYATWKEASEAAQRLGIRTRREYERRYREDPKLTIKPHRYYAAVWEKNLGWYGFLGKIGVSSDADPVTV